MTQTELLLSEISKGKRVSLADKSTGKNTPIFFFFAVLGIAAWTYFSRFGLSINLPFGITVFSIAALSAYTYWKVTSNISSVSIKGDTAIIKKRSKVFIVPISALHVKKEKFGLLYSYTVVRYVLDNQKNTAVLFNWGNKHGVSAQEVIRHLKKNKGKS